MFEPRSNVELGEREHSCFTLAICLSNSSLHKLLLNSKWYGIWWHFYYIICWCVIPAPGISVSEARPHPRTDLCSRAAVSVVPVLKCRQTAACCWSTCCVGQDGDEASLVQKRIKGQEQQLDGAIKCLWCFEGSHSWNEWRGGEATRSHTEKE